MQERFFYHRIKNLSEIARLINSGEDLDTILERIVYAVCRHSDWLMSGILVVDEDAGESRVVKQFDPYLSDRKTVTLKWDLDTSPVWDVVRNNCPLIIPDAMNSKEFPAYLEDALLRGYRTTVVMPLDVLDEQGRSMVLSVQSREPVDVSDSELSFLRTVSDLVAIAINKAVQIQEEKRKSGKLRATVDIFAGLMQSVLSGSAVEDIMRMLDGFVNVPWIVVDLASDKIVANSTPDSSRFSNESWRDWIQLEGRSQLLRLVSRQTDVWRVKKGMLEVQHRTNVLRFPLTIHPLVVDEEIVGSLLLVGPLHDLDDVSMLQVQVVRLALGAFIMRRVVGFRTRVSSQGAMIRRLLSGDWKNETDFLSQFTSVNVDLATPSRLVMITAIDKGIPPNRQILTRLHQLTERWGGAQLDAKATVEIDAQFLILAEVGKAAEQLDNLKHFRKLFEAFKWHTGQEPIVVFGDVCNALPDYSTAYVQCRRLVHLADSLGVTGIVSAKDFGALPLMVSLAEKNTVQDFLAHTIMPMLNDSGRNTDKLLETAQCFVENEGRYQICAKQLEIHVSTLRYRLKRIRQSFGLDLLNAGTRFDLQLAFKLFEFGRQFKRVL